MPIDISHSKRFDYYRHAQMRESVIEYHTRVCKEVSTVDGKGRNEDDGPISRMSLMFTLSG
jgi:hypothetical protein